MTLNACFHESDRTKVSDKMKKHAYDFAHGMNIYLVEITKDYLNDVRSKDVKK